MKEQVITHRLKDTINAIEEILGLKRKQFTRSEGKDFYDGWMCFSGNPVKASARYLYSIGKESDKEITLSFGFKYLDESGWKYGKKLPIEKQTMTVSYAYVTEKECDKKHGYIGKSDHYDKKIFNCEPMDFNEARVRLKHFKKELLALGTGKKTHHSKVIEVFERVFLDYENKNDNVVEAEFLGQVETYFDTVDSYKTDYYDACHGYKTAKRLWKAGVEESEEYKRVQKLQAELNEANNKLNIKRNELKKEFNVNGCESNMNKAKRNWEKVSKELKQRGYDILKKMGAPFRLNKVVEDRLEIDKKKVL